MLKLSYTLAALCIATYASGVSAQSDETEGGTEGQTGEDVIVVTGGALEEAPSQAVYAVAEIDKELIASSASGRIEDVLRNVAGFQQFRRSDSRSANPSAQGATLRALGGNASSRALVLLDGVPMADPFFGYIPFNAIAPENLGSIAVTRGGGSGPFGSGALSGTIELQSSDRAQLADFAAQALVNGRGETELSGSLTQDLGRGFVTASGNWDRGKGFFTTPDDQRVPASARARFDNWSAGLRAAVPVSDTVELQARTLIWDDRRTLRFDGADSTNEGQDASIRLIGRGPWQFDVLAYIQARNFSNEIISSTRFTRVLDQRNTPSTGLGGKIELRPPVGNAHTLRFGADYRLADGELQEEAYSAFSGALRERRRGGGQNSNLGLFVEDDFQAGPLLLTGGLRADYTSVRDGFYRAVAPDGTVLRETIGQDRNDWSLSWRAGAAYEVAKTFSLRAAAYTGSRLPTLNELYRPFVIFPVVTLANADLENERLEGFEAGFDAQPLDDLSFSVTAFDNRVKNAIANVTLSRTLRQRQNLPAIDAQGIETSLKAKFGSWRLDGSLAYTDAQIDGSGDSIALDGNRPPQVPQWSASARLGWTPRDNWLFAATLRHVSGQFEDDRESDLLEAATTLDLYAEAPISGALSAVLRAENVTNETIVTRNSGGAIDLGAPRTVWIGLKIRR